MLNYFFILILKLSSLYFDLYKDYVDYKRNRCELSISLFKKKKIVVCILYR